MKCWLCARHYGTKHGMVNHTDTIPEKSELNITGKDRIWAGHYKCNQAMIREIAVAMEVWPNTMSEQ